jgi:hypothetical protein
MGYNHAGKLKVGLNKMAQFKGYKQVLRNIEKGLFWLDANARHAIELQETFRFPAYDTSIRELIKGTNKVRCYKICLDALYFEFIMTLMRMYDSSERDTACFQKVFEYLSDNFIEQFQKNAQRAVRTKIEAAFNEFNYLRGSHLAGRLETLRNKMFAHTSTNFNRNQVAKYGQAEKLLERTLIMLNSLNLAIRDRTEPYDKVRKYWEKCAIEFWKCFIKVSQS